MDVGFTFYSKIGAFGLDDILQRGRGICGRLVWEHILDPGQQLLHYATGRPIGLLLKLTLQKIIAGVAVWAVGKPEVWAGVVH